MNTSGGENMKCPKCGKELSGNSNFCPNCGEAIDAETMQRAQAENIYEETGTESKDEVIQNLKDKKDKKGKEGNGGKAFFVLAALCSIGKGIAKFWKKGKFHKLIIIVIVLAIVVNIKGCVTGKSSKSYSTSNDYNNSGETVQKKNVSEAETKETDTETNQEPAQQTTQESTVKETSEATTKSSEESVNGIRPSFKEAIDSYEAFFDSYCAFMIKYKSSEDTAGMLADYTEYMKKYTDTMNKLDGLKGEANDAELKYYTDAMIRINEKLAKAAQ